MYLIGFRLRNFTYTDYLANAFSNPFYTILTVPLSTSLWLLVPMTFSVWALAMIRLFQQHKAVSVIVYFFSVCVI